MQREIGSKDFPIWLIGDSEPQNWKTLLATPLDPRHPIRHNIWTSIMDVVQDKLYRENHKRIDTSSLYIRNAIANSNDKPDRYNVDHWNSLVSNEINVLRNLVKNKGYKPKILFSFGAFSFEFCRRAVDNATPKAYGTWNTKSLGLEFKSRINDFNIDKTNIIPLLHRSIAGGHFLSSHNHFCSVTGGNYFEYAGNEIAKLLMGHKFDDAVYIR